MQLRCGLVLIGLVLAGAAYAQGIGFGMGTDDLYGGFGGGAPPPACGTLVLDFSNSCNLVETVTVGVAR